MKNITVKDLLKRILVVKVLSALLFFSGCSGWVPTMGNYPLGPDKAKNKAIAEYESERQEIEISEQIRHNLMMGKEPYDDVMISLFGCRPY
jgi:hypothetical protein